MPGIRYYDQWQTVTNSTLMKLKGIYKERLDEHDRAVRLGNVTVSHRMSLPAIWPQIWLCRDPCPRHVVHQTTQVDNEGMACQEPRECSNWGDCGHTNTIHTSDMNSKNWMVQTAGKGQQKKPAKSTTPHPHMSNTQRKLHTHSHLLVL